MGWRADEVGLCSQGVSWIAKMIKALQEEGIEVSLDLGSGSPAFARRKCKGTTNSGLGSPALLALPCSPPTLGQIAAQSTGEPVPSWMLLAGLEAGAGSGTLP